MAKKSKLAKGIASIGLSFGILFGANACAKDVAKAPYKDFSNSTSQTQSVGQDFNADFQAQLDSLQNDLNNTKKELESAKKDIEGLKDADKKLLALINSNMESLTESYNNLLKQVNDLAASHKTLAGDVTNLQTQYSALQNQYSALNTQLQSLAETLNSLQAAVQTLQQDTTTQSLAETISALQNKINQLIVENALNLTLNTRYNSITCTMDGKTYTALTNPNGEYVVSSDDYVSVGKDGIRFQNAGGTEYAYFDNKPMIDKITSLVYPTNSIVTNSGSTYTITYPNMADSVVINLDTNGYVVGFSARSNSFGNVNVMHTNEIDGFEYLSGYNYYASSILLIDKYDIVSGAIDKTFNCQYLLLTGEMTADGGVSGTAKGVLTKGSSAQYSTVVTGNNSETYCEIFGNGETSYVKEVNGQLETSETLNAPTTLSPQLMGKSLKQSIFSDRFTINFDNETNLYTINKNGQSLQIQINEGGAFNDFTLMTGNQGYSNQSVNYHVQSVNKATFDSEFQEIKNKMDELIAKYNSNLNV